MSSQALDGVLIKPALVETSNVAGALCALARFCDLVILAAQRGGSLRRLLYRSMDRELLHGQRRPVVLLPSGEGLPDFSANVLPKHLLAPLSGHPSGEVVLGPAAVLSSACAARATLLHVEDIDDGHDRFVHSSPRGYLNWALPEFQKTNVHVSSDVVGARRSLPKTILNYAETHHADMIALASQSQAWLKATGLFERVLTSSNLPLLVCRP